MPWDERAAALASCAKSVRVRGDDLSLAMSEETGATLGWCRENVALASKTLEAVASLPDLSGDVALPSVDPDARSFAVRTPCGVVLSIAPWNAPIVLGARAVAAPLLAGNTVVLKGSEFAPRTFRLLVEVLSDSDLPAGVLQGIVNAADQGEAIVDGLVSMPIVRRVTFTGSTRVGRTVATICGRHIKRCLLELGGQGQALVLGDADLDHAVDAVARSAWLHQGQICMSTERVLVEASIADDFVERLEARRTIVANGQDPVTQTGPVIGKDAVDRVAALIGDAVAKGATLVGGGRVDGLQVSPALIDGVSPGMRLHDEEAFGPVVSITRVRGEDEMIAAADQSEFGLVASIFGRDVVRAERIARSLETGIAHVNGPSVNDDPRAPFGGMKASGYGRFGGVWGLEEFMETRWLTVREDGAARDHDREEDHGTSDTT